MEPQHFYNEGVERGKKAGMGKGGRRGGAGREALLRVRLPRLVRQADWALFEEPLDGGADVVASLAYGVFLSVFHLALLNAYGALWPLWRRGRRASSYRTCGLCRGNV